MYFILCNFFREHLLYFYLLRFLCSLLKCVQQFQSRHNSHTGNCYVISFAAVKRLDVILTIMKTVQCSFSCTQCIQKVGAVRKNCFRSRKLYRQLQNRGASPGCTECMRACLGSIAMRSIRHGLLLPFSAVCMCVYNSSRA